MKNSILVIAFFCILISCKKKEVKPFDSYDTIQITSKRPGDEMEMQFYQNVRLTVTPPSNAKDETRVGINIIGIGDKNCPLDIGIGFTRDIAVPKLTPYEQGISDDIQNTNTFRIHQPSINSKAIFFTGPELNPQYNLTIVKETYDSLKGKFKAKVIESDLKVPTISPDTLILEGSFSAGKRGKFYYKSSPFM